ncbi:MAG: hypothetical protein HQK53_19515, partial [Oligoflexia bacterium]|nr:hypothetical protein [Oligoflexia bacterium]
MMRKKIPPYPYPCPCPDPLMNRNTPFLTYNHFLQQLFGQRVYKVSIDAGLSCPNRDGTLSFDGCAFCDPYGPSSR